MHFFLVYKFHCLGGKNEGLSTLMSRRWRLGVSTLMSRRWRLGVIDRWDLAVGYVSVRLFQRELDIKPESYLRPGRWWSTGYEVDSKAVRAQQNLDSDSGRIQHFCLHVALRPDVDLAQHHERV